MKKNILKFIVAAIAFGSLSANAASGYRWTEKDIDQYKEIMGKLKGIKALPGTGFAIAEGAGSSFMISANGRFVMREVEVLDTWNGKVIRNLDDAQNLERIDFSTMKLRLDELLTFKVGKPTAPENVIFVDPKCGYCKAMLEQVKTMLSTHNFRIVVAPILGEESISIAKRLSCVDKKVAVNAILNNSYADLPSPKEGCDTEPMSRAIIVARLLGNNAVPFTVFSSGNIQRGFVKDLRGTISQDLAREKSKAENAK